MSITYSRSVRDLDVWNKKELEVLNDFKTKTNAFTRFFTLKEVKDRIPATVENDGKFKTDLDKKTFSECIENLARVLILPEGKSSTPRHNTRSSPLEVMEDAFGKGSQLYRKICDKVIVTSPKLKRSQIKLKSDKFFESFRCTVADSSAILILSNEIASINYKQNPVAAIFILRCLLMNSLYRCIRKAKLWTSLLQECEKVGRPNADPGLDLAIEFCLMRKDDIFSGNALRLLERWKDMKELDDLTTSEKWMQTNPAELELVAGLVRPFIEAMLDGSATKAAQNMTG